MTRTKIVATLGPACDSPAVLRAMIAEGLAVARLNFSHGTLDDHARRIAGLRAAAAAEGAVVAVLQDLQGPRLRIGPVQDGTALVEGQAFTLDGRRGAGDAAGAGIAYHGKLARRIRPGQRVLIDDGRLRLVVTGVSGGAIRTEVLSGGPLASRKGVNLPDTELDLPALTEKDRADLRFGLAQGVDYVALSFVAHARDLRRLKDRVQAEGHGVPVIAKIERPAALAALPGILAEADGIMVARGDLALEIGAEKVPVAQKSIIRAANAAAVPVITATQMLESMVLAPQPTRAETSDVANAIFDGSDAVMLSEETAVGRYPVLAVAAMAAVALEAEQALPYVRLGRRGAEMAHGSVTHAISEAAVDIARRLQVKAILAGTSSGRTARAVSHHRPEMPLVGCTTDPAVCRRLALVWGVRPVLVPPYHTVDEQVTVLMDVARRLGLARDGEKVVLVSGQPIGHPGSTNMVQVRRLGDGD
jgi:pyruvate kinase